MSRLQDVTRRAAPMTDEEFRALKLTAGYEHGIYEMQTDDIIRLTVYRRAVKAGYYSDGPADESWVVNPKGSLRSLVTA